MTRTHDSNGVRRRNVLKLGSAALALPAILRHPAHAADAVLGPYLDAKINWRQAEGETVNVAIIPTTFYAGWMALAPQFQDLTGVRVTFEQIPPGQIRNKTVLDLQSKTGTYPTSFTDPMYWPLYAANKWVVPIMDYVGDSKLTDAKWYNFDDIIPAWRAANSYQNQLYGIPFDGEATVQVYRTDLYQQHGLKAAETLDEYTQNAAALHDPANRMWGAALRGFPGPGQNMYIYPSIFCEFGGKWFDSNGKVKVNGPEAEAALEWYINLDRKYAPKGVENWNWPDIADAMGQGILASYIDGDSQAPVIVDPSRSKVIGKIGFARWPKGPSGRRVTSIWNWGLGINAASSKRTRDATWLFIQWSTCQETQARTSIHVPPKGVARLGVDRLSLLNSPEYAKIVDGIGKDFLSAALESMEHDTDPDWRPRVPEWAAIGDIMSVTVQQALVGQATPKDALNNAQRSIDKVLRG